MARERDHRQQFGRQQHGCESGSGQKQLELHACYRSQPGYQQEHDASDDPDQPVVSAGDRGRLEALVADRNQPQKHVARARLVLLSADRLDVAAVARRAGISRPAVWRWQQRYAEAGVDGLLRDRTRKPGKAPLGGALVRRVVALTCAEPPGEATHWTGRAMAATAGMSLRSVQRIWAAH